MNAKPTVKSDWKTFPMPAERTNLSVDRRYSAGEFERIRLGLLPRVMEDKWFAYFDGGCLYLHRSWTGFCIYEILFEAAGEDWRVAGVLASRDASQYTETNPDRDAESATTLLDRLAGRDTSWDESDRG